MHPTPCEECGAAVGQPCATACAVYRAQLTVDAWVTAVQSQPVTESEYRDWVENRRLKGRE